MHDPIPLAPLSWGEVIDKITILEIKADRLSSEAALANVRKELALLTESVALEVLRRDDVKPLKTRLREINEQLWRIEDDIRQKEASKTFDGEFIELARSVYIVNDERARVKREISERLSSGLIEEKSYASYSKP
jgi:predicted nuclease with TOPRIM domain